MGLGGRVVIRRGFTDVARLADFISCRGWFRRCRSSILALTQTTEQTTTMQTTKKPVKFVKNFPFQLAALTHVHNCINWSFFVMQAWLPTYFATELGLDMKSSALFSALPFATMALGSLVSGQASAALLQRMSPFEVRKRMVALSSVVPACSLLALSYVKSRRRRWDCWSPLSAPTPFPLLVYMPM